MDWNKGYTASYHMTIVDPATWRDIDTIQIRGGGISRSADGMMQSADIECGEIDHDREQWVRIYLDTEQTGAYAHEALFTGLAVSPDRAIKGWRSEDKAVCYSVLKPCADVVLPLGWYAPLGADGAEVVRQLLVPSPAPVSVADAPPQLSNAIIAESGETNLSMIEKVLEAINWRLRIDGSGAISIEGKPVKAYVELDPIEYDVIENEIDISRDWYGCPNVLMAVSDDLTAIARDDAPQSPLSTVNRGREVWQIDTDCDLGGEETIGEYARRRLAELQQFEITAEYTRRYIPDLYPGDLVALHYPHQGLDGVYEVQEQDIDLGYAASTGEQIKAPATLADLAETETEIGLVNLIDDGGEDLVDSDGDELCAFEEY